LNTYTIQLLFQVQDFLGLNQYSIISMTHSPMKMWKNHTKKTHQCCARRMLTQLRHRDRSRRN